MFAETREQMKETDRKLSELKESVDKVHQNVYQTIKEIGTSVEKTSQLVNGIGASIGANTEEMIYDAVKINMTFAGIKFTEIFPNLHGISPEHNLEAEFDIVLKNGNTIALIETKHRYKRKDVNYLINKKLNDFKLIFKEYNKYKIILGIGGAGFEKKAIETAKENGIAIIKIKNDKIEYHTDNIKIY